MGKKMEFKIPEMETVEIKCNKDNLLDNLWLFNNIPWSNHDGKTGKLIFDKPTELFYIDMSGFDVSTYEIKNITFDNIVVLVIHGFGGNSYSFDFRLGEDILIYLSDTQSYGFSKGQVKYRFLKSLKSKVKGIKRQLKMVEKEIELIKNL